MPIRFRCAYCSQLMGIARRKAGTVVSCPTCHGQVVVPDPGPGDEDFDKPATETNGPQIFERSDFDKVFAPTPGKIAPSPEPPSPALPHAPTAASAVSSGPASIPEPLVGGTQAEVNFDVERIPSPAAAIPRAGQAGLFLSPTALTLLALLILVLLAVAFVGGLFIGRSFSG